MSAYFAEHAWGNTTLDDLVGSLEQASGRDLQPWRTAWLETAGVDRLGIEHTDDGLVLTAVGAHGAPHPQVVGVGAYRRAGDALEEVGSVRVEVDGERTAVEGLPEADLYLVNHDDTTFATTRPDAAGREVLIGRPSGLPTTLARAVAMATVWDMLSSGEATAAEAVGALTDVLSVETVETVAEPCLELALAAAQQWAPESERVGLEAQVAAAARHLVDAGVSRQSALRALARTAAGEDDLARLREQAGDDVDLQWYVLAAPGRARRRRRRGRAGPAGARPRPRRLGPCALRAGELTLAPRRRRRRGPRWWSAPCPSRPPAPWRQPSGGPARTTCWRRTPSATSRRCPPCTRAG